MYLCGICRDMSQPGQLLLKHQVTRTNGQTAKEVPVCPTCHELLSIGIPYPIVVRKRGKKAPKRKEYTGPAIPVTAEVGSTVPVYLSRPVRLGSQDIHIVNRIVRKPGSPPPKRG